MEIIKTYLLKQPAARFIGKKYGPEDSVNGSYGPKWGEAFGTGLFEKIEAARGTDDFFEDSLSYIGLMSAEGDEYTYWIGMFAPSETPVPEGMDYKDFQADKLGVCWLYGKEDELYRHEGDVIKKLSEIGAKTKTIDGKLWCFERYQCPRFTTPDDKGNVILDICFFVE